MEIKMICTIYGILFFVYIYVALFTFFLMKFKVIDLVSMRQIVCESIL